MVFKGGLVEIKSSLYNLRKLICIFAVILILMVLVYLFKSILFNSININKTDNNVPITADKVAAVNTTDPVAGLTPMESKLSLEMKNTKNNC